MNVLEEIVVVVLVMNTSRFHVLPPALNTSAQLVNICNNYKKLSPDGTPTPYYEVRRLFGGAGVG